VKRILIIGGYGAFGRRAAERLARAPDLEIVVAGRSARQAEACAASLAVDARAKVAHAAVDAENVNPDGLRALAPHVVINAAGPFQGRNYHVARVAIACGCHYVDLADARGFVTDIAALDEEAKAAGVLVVSGASSVPGLSSAVVEAYAGEFAALESLDIGISPGNSFDPGAATVASVLRGLGRPVRITVDGEQEIVHGWQSLSRHRFPVLGPRWMSNVDVPDLDLFPSRFPSLETARFKAGLEVSISHLGLWALSWLVRAGLLREPERLAGPLLSLKRRLAFLGSDEGGMFVRMRGTGSSGMPLELEWSLIARHGDGPYIPAVASVVLARKLARGAEPRRGAMPCFGLVTLEEFMNEVSDLAVTGVLLRREGPSAPVIGMP
jgi:saccharopine dehydrogenase-like NADP-dependent oxidoreductase